MNKLIITGIAAMAILTGCSLHHDEAVPAPSAPTSLIGDAAVLPVPTVNLQAPLIGNAGEGGK